MKFFVLFFLLLGSGISVASAARKHIYERLLLSAQRVLVERITVQNSTNSNVMLVLDLVTRSYCFRYRHEKTFLVAAHQKITYGIRDDERLNLVFLRDATGANPASESWSMRSSATNHLAFIVTRNDNRGLYVLEPQDGLAALELSDKI